MIADFLLILVELSYEKERDKKKQIASKRRTKRIFAATCIFLHQIKNLYANLCEYFEANMKGMNENKWCLGMS
jgi:hypothetical protein